MNVLTTDQNKKSGNKGSPYSRLKKKIYDLKQTHNMYSNKLQTKQQKKKISKSKDLFYMGIPKARI